MMEEEEVCKIMEDVGSFYVTTKGRRAGGLNLIVLF
jgi:hypothetical protein